MSKPVYSYNLFTQSAYYEDRFSGVLGIFHLLDTWEDIIAWLLAQPNSDTVSVDRGRYIIHFYDGEFASAFRLRCG